MKKKSILFLRGVILYQVPLLAQWQPTSGPVSAYITALAGSGTSLFAGTSFGLYLSTNSGASWTQLNTGNNGAKCLAVSGSTLIASRGFFSPDRVAVSTDNGVNWTLSNNTLQNPNVINALKNS